MAARRYAHYRRDRGAAPKSSSAKVVANNPLLHVDYAKDYGHTSSLNSGYCTFTPTKDKQVFQSFLIIKFSIKCVH